MSHPPRCPHGLSLLEVLVSLALMASVTLACGPILSAAARPADPARLSLSAPAISPPAELSILADRCLAAATDTWIEELSAGPVVWNDPEHAELGSISVERFEQPSGVPDRTLVWLVMRQGPFTAVRLWAIVEPDPEVER